jgi:hypothetical protein
MKEQLQHMMELHAKVGGSLLGKPVSEIPKTINEHYQAYHAQMATALEEMRKDDAAGAVLSQAASNGTWYFGSISTGGLIYGDLSATLNFPTVMKFSGSGWSGPQAIAGGGGGLWSMVPSDGQKMDFALGAASWGAGEVQVYWSIDGTVVGQLVAGVGGAAISGMSGSGKWSKS